MRLKISVLTAIAAVFFSTFAQAQEFNFSVKVSNPQVRVADPQLFKSLEQAIRELINNTKWTDDVFEQNERITGSIQVTIKTENSATSFVGELAIQMNRPIYGTDQTTPLFVHLDKDFSFSYEQFQPLQYVQNAYNDNLTAVLSYYAHVMLAMDYDSFAPLGGEQYWQRAQDIFNTVPQGARSEWQGRELDNRRRYWFVENVLSPRLKNFRQAIYEYHRLGLDVASSDLNRCKSMLVRSLEHMEEAQQGYPNTLAIRTFSITKGDEIIDIFKNGTPEEKQKVIQLMAKIDPANAGKYNQVGF